MTNTPASNDLAITVTPVVTSDRQEIPQVALTQAQVAAEIRDAVSYIEAHGWTQQTFLNKETGAVCAVGAVGKSMTEKYALTLTMLDTNGVEHKNQFLAGDVPKLRMKVIDTLAKASPYESEEPYLAIASFNDDAERTQAEVTKWMLKVADETEVE